MMAIAQNLIIDTPSSEALQINDVITVTGSVLTNFCVNFKVNSNIALHFCPRCASNLVIRNTLNGRWGPEERIGGMQIPCSQGDDISLAFKLTASKWEVSSFGERLTNYDYAHRVPSSIDTTTIQVSGVTNPALFINSVAIFTAINNVNGQTVTCVEGEECTVTCNGEISCMQATIFCPSDQQCNIVCSGHSSCYESVIHWSTTPGLGTISCTGAYACRDVHFPVPDPNTPYSMQCDDYACYEVYVNCPESAACDIGCVGEYACRGAVINWPTTPGLGALSCSGASSCRGVNFPVPDPNTPYEVECDSYDECDGATINCPESAACGVHCAADYACDSATINWPNDEGSVYIPTYLHCDEGTNVCDGANEPLSSIHSIDLFIPSVATFTEYNGLKRKTVACVEDEECTVTCSGAYSCNKATIVCRSDQRCNIICSAEGACSDAVIHWPTTPGLGTISCTGDHSCGDVNFPVPDPNTPYSLQCNDYECHGATINCPESAACDIGCVADFACIDAVINWPTTPGLGALSCGGRSSCRGVNFPVPDPNTPYEVECDSDHECYEATINCPESAACGVHCAAYGACGSATINWPNDEGSVYIPTYLHCEEGTNACGGANEPLLSIDLFIYSVATFTADAGLRGKTVACVADEECTVTCNGYHSCMQATIFCTSDQQCNIVCSGPSSCYESVIHWSTTPGLGTISCTGAYSCREVHFPVPDPNTPYSMQCDYYACFGATINCPESAACDIGCVADYACRDAAINWPTTPGLGALSCSGGSSCRGVNFPVPDPNTPYEVECDSYGECRDTTINCPESAACGVHCAADYACDSATINWPKDVYEGNAYAAAYLHCEQGTHVCDGANEPLLQELEERLSVLEKFRSSVLESKSHSVPMTVWIVGMLSVFVAIWITFLCFAAARRQSLTKHVYQSVAISSDNESDV